MSPTSSTGLFLLLLLVLGSSGFDGVVVSISGVVRVDVVNVDTVDVVDEMGRGVVVAVGFF